MGALCCIPRKEDIVDNGPTLDHFDLLGVIDRGVFGQVRLARHKRTKQMVALKTIRKDSCIRAKATAHVLAERCLLERLHHPFIVKLCYAFQDENYLFVGLDLLPGGNLRRLLDLHSSLTEGHVRFYIAELVLALHYLHRQCITHRDIKPENLLLDSQGHCHLCDFNIAIEFDQDNPVQWSKAGSLAYMAPEILARKGYSTSVDWWSVGVVAYELLFGKRPFSAPSNDQLTQAILYSPLEFPSGAYGSVSKECIDVLSGLLDKSPMHRLGEGPHDLKLKSHPWFAGIDWDRLERRMVTPPHVPKRSSLTVMFDNDKLQHSEQQRQPKRLSLTKLKCSQVDTPVTEDARIRQWMEDAFLNYDHNEYTSSLGVKAYLFGRLFTALRHNRYHSQGYMIANTCDPHSATYNQRDVVATDVR